MPTTVRGWAGIARELSRLTGRPWSLHAARRAGLRRHNPAPWGRPTPWNSRVASTVELLTAWVEAGHARPRTGRQRSGGAA